MCRKLVAYFSASGVTRAAAKALAEAAGADLYEIKPELPYSDADLNWRDNNSRSTIEFNNPSSRPPIANSVDNMDEYDAVFVGFPIWWYIAPRIIETFLESYDFSGKTVVPFATSGSSGMGKTDEVLRTCCSARTEWRPGKRLDGRASSEELSEWVKSLKLEK